MSDDKFKDAMTRCVDMLAEYRRALRTAMPDASEELINGLVISYQVFLLPPQSAKS